MKLKYVLNKSDKNELTISEFSPLDKKESEMYTLLYEEHYDSQTIEEALEGGKNALMAALRTPNLYPQDVYALQLCEVVTQMYADKKSVSQEVIFDDYDLLTKISKGKVSIEEIEEDIDEDDDNIELDDLLEDDDAIKNIKTSIQVADEEDIDVDKDDENSNLLI